MIPGWQERAHDEAAWAAFVHCQDADPHAVAIAYTIFQMTPPVTPPDVSLVEAPVFTHYGLVEAPVFTDRGLVA